MVGVYYLSEDITSHQEAYADDFLTLGALPLTFLRTVDDDLQTDSYAAVRPGDYAINRPAVNVTVGLRYTKEDKDYFRTTSTFSNLRRAATAPSSTPTTTAGMRSRRASPLDYQVTDDSLLYASAGRGFKSGGFNGRANDAAANRRLRSGVRLDLRARQQEHLRRRQPAA